MTPKEKFESARLLQELLAELPQEEITECWNNAQNLDIEGTTIDELLNRTILKHNKEQKDELLTSAQMAQNHLLCDVNDEDDFDDEDTPPDYYQCMCCGNVQSRSYSCNRCAGPMAECWY